VTALTRQERIERGDANRKAREELRNAVRFAMSKDGVSPSQIRDAAKDMAKEAAAAAMKSLTKAGTFEELMRKVVREEMNAFMQRAQGSNTTLGAVIQKAITEEAQRYAKDYIDKNVLITMQKDTF
jgi:membrane peptidoglycan carboxypeptidase